MGRKSILFCLISLFMVVWLASCQSNQIIDSQSTPGGTPTPPEEYATMSNPLSGETQSIANGEVLYQADCASCHGVTGQGDGPAGLMLDPKPVNLAVAQNNLRDSYLYWRISEGGLMEPFNSMMPAWKGILREDQIWQIISYLRTLD